MSYSQPRYIHRTELEEDEQRFFNNSHHLCNCEITDWAYEAIYLSRKTDCIHCQIRKKKEQEEKKKEELKRLQEEKSAKLKQYKTTKDTNQFY
jgi:hypothetical protein